MRVAAVDLGTNTTRLLVADVDEQRARLGRPEPAPHQCRLLAAREQPRHEAVAPLDLAEERLAVLRVTDGARGDEQRPLGAERLGGAAVVGEGVANPGDRDREELAAGIDPFAEARDPRLAVQFVDEAVVDVADDESRRVRPLVDRGDDHLCGTTVAPSSPRAAIPAGAPRMNAAHTAQSHIGPIVDPRKWGCYNRGRDAGWSSQVARRAHNPEVAGSNPAPATQKGPEIGPFSFVRGAMWA